MPRKPGNHLAIERARNEFGEFVERYKLEIDAESTPRHLDNVRMACVLLLEKWNRIQGGETLETRAKEEQLDRLAARARSLWSAAPLTPVVKARPRLSLIPGGLS